MFPPEFNPTSGMHRILVVDDEEMVLKGLRDTLAREGYNVVTSSNPFLALEELKTQNFSVIISDQHMPGMLGMQFLAQARDIQSNASRILITAVLSLDTVIDAINKGEIYRFIVKPWLREELLATVKNAVQRYELIDNNTLLQSKSVILNRELSESNRLLELQVARIAEQNECLGQLNKALEENLQHSVQLCLHVLQTFNPGLGNKARRVHQVCTAIADTLHLPAEKRQILEFSAWLHDIGLVAIHRDLIHRWDESPEGLKQEELEALQSHPVRGQNLVKFGNHLEEVGSVIRAHHEHFDGKGFPDQLKGEEIPWLARLLAVAVGFAESNLEELRAIESIRLGAGNKYDPEAVRTFLRAISKVSVSRKEREILISELRPGMVLAKGIYTPNGLLIVPEGQLLNVDAIGKIVNHNRTNPIIQSLLVYC
ncbi:MAG: response regulator [Verrucomicrobia bacterium]|nr:MAG: response regulator [Verrucomicrobiota bacterium]